MNAYLTHPVMSDYDYEEDYEEAKRSYEYAEWLASEEHDNRD